MQGERAERWKLVPRGHPVPGLYLLPGTLTSHGKELGTHPPRAGKLTFSKSSHFSRAVKGAAPHHGLLGPLPPLSFHV